MQYWCGVQSRAGHRGLALARRLLWGQERQPELGDLALQSFSGQNRGIEARRTEIEGQFIGLNGRLQAGQCLALLDGSLDEIAPSGQERGSVA